MHSTKLVLFFITAITILCEVRSQRKSDTCKRLKLKEGLMSSVFEDLDYNLAMDNKMETFSHSVLESDPFIMVMFNEEKVGDVKIYNVQQDCCYDQLEGATVSVFNEDFDERKCGKITNVKKTDEYVKVNCKGYVGTSVKIEIPGEKYLHVREIEVYKKCAADERKEKKESEKKKKGGDSRCSNGLTFCDGTCKHIHMCGKSFG